MGKGKLADLVSTIFENGSQEFLESELFKTATTELGMHIVEEGTAIAIGTALAAITPRLNSIRLTYLEKRFERNVKQAIYVLSKRIDDLDSRLNALPAELQSKFRNQYLDWILDNICNEKQEEKITYHINGYINSMEDDTTDDIMLLFLETLNQLTVLDIDVLKMYSYDYDENWQSVCERRGISYDQLNMVKAKLERFGLLYSNNDDRRDENLDMVASYLEKRVKEENKKNARIDKINLGRLKKVNRSESYSITRLGRDFLKKIG